LTPCGEGARSRQQLDRRLWIFKLTAAGPHQLSEKMKAGVLTQSRIATLIVLACGVSMIVRGQVPTTTPGRSARTDKIQRELERRVEMQMIEQAMVVGGSPRVKRYPPLVLDQIREDFLRIQVNANVPLVIPAFPGAEGFGATTPGGRGGKVPGDKDKDGYTNLEEYLNNTDPNKYVDYRIKNVASLLDGRSIQGRPRSQLRDPRILDNWRRPNEKRWLDNEA
jgi:hypothetical protein